MKKLLYFLFLISAPLIGCAQNSGGDRPASASAGVDYLNLAQDATVKPYVDSYVTNVRANGGSLSEINVGALNYFLKGLNQMGVLTLVDYFNPFMGNNYQASATNVINTSGVNYCTTSGTFDDSYYNPKTGWLLPTGVNINTGYNPTGRAVAPMVRAVNFSQNVSSSSRLFGTTTDGLLKLNNTTGTAWYIQGRGNLTANYNNFDNISGNHILYSSSSGNQWYIDGTLYTDNTTNTSATYPSGNILVNSSNTNFLLYIRSALNATNIVKLARLIDNFNAMIGRPNYSNRYTLNTALFEGDSKTASFNPAGGTLVPTYISQVITNEKITQSGWQVAQLAVSGKLSENMLTDATGNTRLFNTLNFSPNLNNIYIYAGGTNSLGNGTVRTADDIYNNLIVPTLRNRVAAGYTVLIETITPTSTYTAFVAGGLANYNSTTTGARRLNYLIKSDPNNYNGVNANGVILSDEQPYEQDPANTTYFGDGLHYTVAANAIRSVLVADKITRVLGGKMFTLSSYTSNLVQNYTSSATLSRDFSNINLNGTGITITIPDATQFYNMEYTLNNIGSSVVTVAGGYSGTIALASRLRLRSNGSTWLVL